ncbi:MAG: penicillin-insensitive murein endopeptidase [Planctomycetes bacterium]|nr:penicillin-insensitive murein endopeptidase [Planctomycetota bacterium]
MRSSTCPFSRSPAPRSRVRRVLTGAAALFALSLGSLRGADDLGYVLMPPASDGTYRVSTGAGDNRHWGRPETVRMLVLVAREWHRRHGAKAVLDIGDISRRDGGPFPPHVTHRDGLNIDITTSPANLCHIDYADQELSLELARLFFHYGAEQILYNGKYVQSQQKGVTQWPKHDDHFHVIVDPKKVPAEGEPLLVADADSLDGSALGPARTRQDKPGGPYKFTLAWRVLGVPDRWQREYRVVFDTDTDETNGFLYDSGRMTGGGGSQLVTAALENEKDYWWRVVVTGPAGPLTLAWQKLRTDFTPPVIELKGPAEGEDIAENPLLAWTCDAATRQAAFRVQLTTDATQKRIGPDSGELAATDAEYRVKGQLARGRPYWWRVSVHDGHGNRAWSAWRSFKVGEKYAWLGDIGTVTSEELNLREGPGDRKDVLLKLKQGARVYVVGRKDEWLQVVVVDGNRRLTGFVSEKYVKQ